MTSLTTSEAKVTPRQGYGLALGIALASAAAFGLSGSLARSLLDLGWSPAAVVGVRLHRRRGRPAAKVVKDSIPDP